MLYFCYLFRLYRANGMRIIPAMKRAARAL
jgi:hypothetical protein